MREYLNFTQSLNPGGEVIDYPLKLDTLQRLVRSSLPLLRLLRKSVPVTLSKQPSLPMKQKEIGKLQQSYIEPPGFTGSIQLI